MALKKTVFVGVLLLSGMMFALAQAPVTQNNWINHPEIVEIRQIYNEVEKMIGDKKLMAKKKSFDYSSPNEPTGLEIYYAADKLVRKYVYKGGSEDSSLCYQYYYDISRRLRFVFITGAAVNGSKLERRVYYNSLKKRIWEIEKGTGDYWPAVWPEEAMIGDPWTDFNRHSS